MSARTSWERFKAEAKALLPWLGAGVGTGMLIGGYFGAIENGNQIRKINKRLDNHSRVISQHAHAGNQLVAVCEDQERKIEDLERQQRLLMEQALRATKGE